jgi:hypothetical protein
MNLQAAVKGIAPAGGIRPASHITASPVSATKAGPAAHTLDGCCQRSQMWFAQPILNFVGQRSRPDGRYGLGILGRRPIELGRLPYGGRKFGPPCAEKVSAHRSRQNKPCCASISVRHHERPLPWKASRLRDPSAGLWLEVAMGNKSGSSIGRGMLTITGSNVRRGTEMPVAATIF